MQATETFRSNSESRFFAWPQNLNLQTLFQPPFSFSPLTFRFALFAVSIACYGFSQTVGTSLGAFNLPFIVAGSACGFSWLLARSLFRGSTDTQKWPWALVGFILATAAFLQSVDLVAAPSAALQTVDHAIYEAHILASSAALLLTFIEPISGFKRSLSQPERYFRLGFLAFYGSLILFAVLLVDQANPTLGHFSFEVKLASAILALIGASVAVWYRLAQKQSARSVAKADEDQQLADDIRDLLETKALYQQRDLKVADLAEHLGVPDYKVSRCVTGVLGQPNFNRLINHYRIAYARGVLEDEERCRHSVLSIALESGFSSIGPFNAAFKLETGESPGRYRERVLANT